MPPVSFFFLPLVFSSVIAVGVWTPDSIQAGQSAPVRWDLDLTNGGGVYDHLVFTLRWPGSLEPIVLARIDCNGQVTGETEVPFPQTPPGQPPYHVEACYPDQNGGVVGIGPTFQLLAATTTSRTSTTILQKTNDLQSTSLTPSTTNHTTTASTASATTVSTTSKTNRSTTVSTAATSSSKQLSSTNDQPSSFFSQSSVLTLSPSETQVAPSGLEHKSNKTGIAIILSVVLGSGSIFLVATFLICRRRRQRRLKELALTQTHPLTMADPNTPQSPGRARMRSKLTERSSATISGIATDTANEINQLREEAQRWRHQIQLYVGILNDSQPPAYTTSN